LTKAVTVHPLPVVNFSIPSICLPDGRGQFFDSSTISDGTQGQFSYVWNFGDAANPTPSILKNPIHRFSGLGPYNVKLIVRSANGCIDSLTKQISSIYPQPKAMFTVSPTDSCLGATFRFTDLSNGVTSPIRSWNWNFGDGTTSTMPNPSRRYTTAGVFNASLSIVNQQGCPSDTVIVPVGVYDYPVVNAGPDLFVLEGGSSPINATATGIGLSYLWTPATFLNKDTVLVPLTSPNMDITYKLTVTGRGGCVSSDEVFVKLLKAPVIPNAFSPNGDGINDTWVIKYLESYPGATVEVFNRYGQIMYFSTGYSKPWDGKSNGVDLPVGTYYYIVNPKNGRKALSGSLTILR
jgi:gliding motility-associated-like protein